MAVREAIANLNLKIVENYPILTELTNAPSSSSSNSSCEDEESESSVEEN